MQPHLTALRDRVTCGRRHVVRLVTTLFAAAAASGCSPAIVLNELLVPADGFELAGDIPYGSAERQRLDVYVPRPARAEPAPVVVFFYGGSWRSGRRDYYRFIGEAFARLGFVVVVPDYRLYPDVRFPAFVEDGALALRWVRDHVSPFGGDAERIALMGHSAGAHIAALLAIDDRYLAAAGVPASSLTGMIGLAGPYAIDPMAYDTTRPVFAGLADVDQARPTALVDASVPPMLLAHGEDDTTVRPVNSALLADAIDRAGGTAEYAVYPGRGHIGLVLSLATPFRGRDRVYEDVVGFLERLSRRPAG